MVGWIVNELEKLPIVTEENTNFVLMKIGHSHNSNTAPPEYKSAVLECVWNLMAHGDARVGK
jgi:hypothetical protein